MIFNKRSLILTNVILLTFLILHLILFPSHSSLFEVNATPAIGSNTMGFYPIEDAYVNASTPPPGTATTPSPTPTLTLSPTLSPSESPSPTPKYAEGLFLSNESLYAISAFIVIAIVIGAILALRKRRNNKPSDVATTTNAHHVSKATNKKDEEMLNVLRRLCSAYMNYDFEKPTIARLEPLARDIGWELHRSGGIQEMRRIFQKLGGIPGSRTLEMHWNGIGDWRG